MHLLSDKMWLILGFHENKKINFNFISPENIYEWNPSREEETSSKNII
jgi:hypothetical protein